MAMRVSKSNSFALTVSADHLVGRYDLEVRIVTFWSGPIHPDYHDRTSLWFRKGSTEQSIQGMAV
jgi:hypothetical protein